MLLPVPNSGGEVAHASTDAFVCAWARRRHYELHCSMVLKLILAFSASIYLSTQQYDTSSTASDEEDDKNWKGATRTTPLCLWSIRGKDQKPCWYFRPAMSPFGNTRPRHLGLWCPLARTPGLGSTARIRTHVVSTGVHFARWRNNASICSNCDRKMIKKTMVPTRQ